MENFLTDQSKKEYGAPKFNDLGKIGDVTNTNALVNNATTDGGTDLANSYTS